MKSDQRTFGFAYLLSTLKRVSLVYLLGIILYSVEGLFSSILSGELYRIVIRMSEAEELSGLFTQFGLFLAGLILLGLASGFGVYLLQNAVSKSDKDIRLSIIGRLTRVPISIWQTRSKGYWFSLMNRDVDIMSESKRENIPQLIRMSFTIVGGLFITMRYRWEMAFFSLLAGGLYFVTAYAFKNHVKTMELQQQKTMIEATDTVSSIQGAYAVVKYYEMESAFKERHDDIMDEYDRLGRKYVSFATLERGLSSFGYSFSYVGLLVLGLFLTYQKKISLADAMYIWPIAMGVCYAIQKISFTVLEMQKELTASARVKDLMDQPLEPEEPEKPVEPRTVEPLIDSSERISVRDLNFAYPGADRRALTDVDLKILAGEKIALVGLSGSGKTTLMKLLLLLYRDYQGEILLDGREVKTYSLDELRKKFSYLPQYPILFEGTVEENLRFVKENATEAELRTALRKAELKELVGHGGDILHVQVGHQGMLVSGGERQRIGLARCYLRDADIFLLDEMTSALDAHLENKLVQDIFGVKGLTLIYITHRLNAATYADKVIVMDDGGIVQQGTHAELIRDQEGLYARLVEEDREKEQS